MSLTREQMCRYAVQLRDNPLFSALIEQLRQDAIYEWSQANYDDTLKREHAWHRQRAVTSIEQAVQNLVEEAERAK